MNASLYFPLATANLNKNIIFKSTGSKETHFSENNNPLPLPYSQATPENLYEHTTAAPCKDLNAY